MIGLLRKRRSIRRFQSKKIEKRKLLFLQEALLRSPSSRDIKPWRFFFIDDAGLLAGLSRCKEHGAEFLAGAPLGIVVCGDETKSDVWVEDCSIASIIVQMTALSLGLGSCWIQVRNRQHAPGVTAEGYIREALGIPARLRVESIIALGYPAEKRKPVSRSKLDFKKISFGPHPGIVAASRRSKRAA